MSAMSSRFSFSGIKTIAGSIFMSKNFSGLYKSYYFAIHIVHDLVSFPDRGKISIQCSVYSTHA